MMAHSRHNQQGTATVEFALTAPLLLLLLLALAELGWAFNQYITLVTSVREGARYAAQHALAGSQGVIDLSGALVDTVRELVVYGAPGQSTPRLPGWSASDVQVTSYDASHIAVTATYRYRPMVVSSIPGYFGAQIPLVFTMQTEMVVRAL